VDGLPQEQENAMPQGRVKWFNDSKGYGFINDEAHDEDIFVHYSQIQQEGFKTLEAGETVDFTVKESPKGLRAEEVARLKEEAES
jgi:CspA family cold shock protein